MYGASSVGGTVMTGKLSVDVLDVLDDVSLDDVSLLSFSLLLSLLLLLFPSSSFDESELSWAAANCAIKTMVRNKKSSNRGRPFVDRPV